MSIFADQGFLYTGEDPPAKANRIFGPASTKNRGTDTGGNPFTYSSPTRAYAATPAQAVKLGQPQEARVGVDGSTISAISDPTYGKDGVGPSIINQAVNQNTLLGSIANVIGGKEEVETIYGSIDYFTTRLQSTRASRSHHEPGEEGKAHNGFAKSSGAGYMGYDATGMYPTRVYENGDSALLPVQKECKSPLSHLVPTTGDSGGTEEIEGLGNVEDDSDVDDTYTAEEESVEQFSIVEGERLWKNQGGAKAAMDAWLDWYDTADNATFDALNVVLGHQGLDIHYLAE